jgi:hypothetical protein
MHEREFSSCLFTVTKLTREAYATTKLVARVFFLCVGGHKVIVVPTGAFYRSSCSYPSVSMLGHSPYSWYFRHLCVLEVLSIIFRPAMTILIFNYASSSTTIMFGVPVLDCLSQNG